jgi:aspartate/glutamate racemase
MPKNNGTNATSPRRIAILGGVGARASARLHSHLIETWSRSGSVQDDWGFPTLLHLSTPLAGLGLSGVSDETLLLKSLRDLVPVLTPFQPDCLLVACNSLHPYALHLTAMTGVPVLTPVDAIQLKAATWAGDTAVLLQSQSLRNADSYRKALGKLCIQVIEPEGAAQVEVDRLIASLVCGSATPTPALECYLNDAVSKDVPIILGCTELTMWPVPERWNAVDSLTELSQLVFSKIHYEHSQRAIWHGPAT